MISLASTIFARSSRSVAGRVAVLLGLLAGSGCTTASLDDLGVASTEISPALVGQMAAAGFRPQDPVLIRIFKEESELEVWKQRADGRFGLLKTYPICRWSGKLGPKMKDGDRQAPEGFYYVSAGLMNPQSHYYRSFNLGFPNKLERALGYKGEALMVHGACSSSGCFAMTDQGVGEIYAVADKALSAGQKRFQVQAYPFRMTVANLSAHRNDPHMPFWQNLYEGYSYFESSHREPKVSACGGKYVFNRIFRGGEPADPLRVCPADINSALPEFATAKPADTTPDIPLAVHENAYADGGMNEAYRELLKKFGPAKLAARISTTSYPISRPDAALTDPFEK